MEWTRTDAARRRLVMLGLVLGPVLTAASVVIGLGGAMPESMRASFDVMAMRSGQILAQDLLETVGFAIVLTALAAATLPLRARGSVLGVVGAVLAFTGIAGFALTNGSGLTVVALAQLPDRDAAFHAAAAITSNGPIAVAGTVGWLLEIAGQVGILLVLAGLWRGRIAPPWPLLLAVIGVLVNAVIGTMVATLAADVLLLATCTWVAVLLGRLPRENWLGATTAQPRASGRTAVGTVTG
jgi:hypothetical protein